MTARPVASVPKELALHHAAPAVADASDQFSQLLVANGPLPFNTISANTNPAADNAASGDHAKFKAAKSDADAASAAAASPTPAPAAPVTAAIAAGTILTQAAVSTSAAQAGVVAGQVQAGVGASPTQAAGPSPAQIVAGSAQGLAVASMQAAPPAQGAAAAAAGAATGGVTTGQATSQPFGAAELEARVAAGAPTYLSQPNSVLAGLWHHAGDAVKGDDTAAANDPSTPGTDGNDADDAALPGATTLSAKAVAAFAAALTPPSHAAPGVDGALTPDPGGTLQPTPAVAGGASGTPGLPLPATANSVTAAASAGAAPPTPLPLPLMSAAAQVAINLKQAAQDGTDRIQIQLKPPSLGAIDVKLDLGRDGRLSAVISADRSDTLNLLRQDASGLEQALRDAGLNADSGSLSFNLRGDAQSFAQNSSPAQGASLGGTAGAPTEAAIDATRLRRHDGALDIHV